MPINDIIPIYSQDVQYIKYFFKNSICRKKGKGNFDNIKEFIKKNIQKNHSIVCYVETIRCMQGKVGRVRTGIFKISQELNIPITPVVIDKIYYDDLYKMPMQNFHIYIGKTFVVTNVTRSVYEFRQLIKNKLSEFSKNKFNSNIN